MDPYEELGVERDADEQKIRKAYRDKAKTAHPDRGGDREGWERVSRSLAVLTDPKARETFDRTGQFEDPAIDNDRVGALEVIYSHLGVIVNEYIGKNFDPRFDPRSRDIPEEIADLIIEEIATAEVNIRTGKKVIEYQRDVKGRFRFIGVGTDAIEAGFDKQIKANEEALKGLDESIRIRKLALDILADYEFEKQIDIFTTDNGDIFVHGTFRGVL